MADAAVREAVQPLVDAVRDPGGVPVTGHHIGHVLKQCQGLQRQGGPGVRLPRRQGFLPRGLGLCDLPLNGLHILEDVPPELEAVQPGDRGRGPEPDLPALNQYRPFHQTASGSAGIHTFLYQLL